MRYQLGLSAEPITDRVADIFFGVGLLRGEYLVRKLGQYFTRPAARDYVADYVNRVARLMAPQPVWYRLAELETSEVNVLAGCDHVIEEKTSMLGLRGTRRALRFPDTFRLEVGILADLSRRHENLHLLLPFVYDPREVAQVRRTLDELGFANRLGIMAEIPSAILCLDDFLDLGIDQVTLGMNDLTSLTLGVARSAPEMDFVHPAVRRLVAMAREATGRRGATLSAAGYLDRAFLAHAEEAGLDFAVLHYSKLPAVLGARWQHLPHMEDLDRIKRQTRAQVRAWQDARAVARLGAQADAPAGGRSA